MVEGRSELIRKPAVAGHFYSNDSEELGGDIDSFVSRATGSPRSVIGIISPHAGYKYSGATAGLVYGSTQLPSRFVLLGPKHRPGGANLSIQLKGYWRTPLGSCAIDSELAAIIHEEIPELVDDPVPQQYEHALEVQVPFLQRLQPDATFVPITMGFTPWKDIQRMGRSLASILTNSDTPTLIVASSDMNHYEDQARTLEKDQLALDAVTALDPEKLIEVCQIQNVSMCGVIPTATMLVAALQLGATQAVVLEHTTSAAVSGDTDRVVGYAGVQVF